MTKKDVCHFCNKDYTEDDETILVNDPFSKVTICEFCAKMGAIFLVNQKDHIMPMGKCDICGETPQKGVYGQSPFICGDCLFVVMDQIFSEGIIQFH